MEMFSVQQIARHKLFNIWRPISITLLACHLQHYTDYKSNTLQVRLARLIRSRLIPMLFPFWDAKHYTRWKKDTVGPCWDFALRCIRGSIRQRQSPTDVVTTWSCGVAPVVCATTFAPCVSVSPMWCPPIATTTKALQFRLVSLQWWKHQWCPPTCQVTTSMTEAPSQNQTSSVWASLYFKILIFHLLDAWLLMTVPVW